MGVAGNLKDLTLIEFLQTIAMSRKSGVLAIRSGDESAWLGLRDGAVVRVALSGQELSRARALAHADLDEKSAAEEIEACLSDAAIGAVIGLLSWTEGEFTFEPEHAPDAAWPGPEGLLLPSSLSPEFLALEGARLEDQAEIAADLGEPVVPEAPAEESAPSPLAQGAAGIAAVIAVDPDLLLLEAIKQALQGDERPVHIFQDPDDALRRAKQYFLRGQVPTLVIGQGSRAEDQSSRAGWRTLVSGARRMVPTVRVILLRTTGSGPRGVADQELARCNPARASSEELQAFLKQLAGAVGAVGAAE